MTAPMTHQQAQFRRNLIEHAIERYTPPSATLPDERMQAATQVALMLSLPTPTTAAEASTQIDALHGNMMDYVHSHRDWAIPILRHLAVRFGQDGAGIPDRRPDGSEFRPSDFRAFAEAAL